MTARYIAHTRPYAWPYDGLVDARRTALLITGAGPTWASMVPRDEPAATRLDTLRSCLRSAGAVVVLVANAPAFVRPTVRPAACPSVALVAGPDEFAIAAAGIDGFYGSCLDAFLRRRGRTHLVVCGYGLESTVHSTVRRANDRGYECLTIVDASPAHDRDLVHASRSSIEMSGGIFGAVGQTDDVIAAYGTEPRRV